ncbi:MAG: AAA family ATPase [Chitinophagaceae bacterium]|nr:AAA family ATPase [Chitinophagaceae bacterium]
MEDLHPHLQRLLKCIELEEKEEVQRYRLDQQHTLKSLKAEGLALHPLKVTRKTFGYADYPEIQFRLNFPAETNQFRDGTAIECFIHGEEPIKGVLLSLEGRVGEFRLFAPDFPDWIEEEGLGIKLSPDQRTTSLMKKALRQLPADEKLFGLFNKIHGNADCDQKPVERTQINLKFKNTSLNSSQQQAVREVVTNDEICIIHGPPGTGKTTTLIEAIAQLVNNKEKVLVSAPSNAAVDNIATGLNAAGLKILRVGNTSKISDEIFPFTIEGKMTDPKQKKEIKELKIRAEQFRKMALKYKRSFGKAEREQRNLLFKEVKNIRTEIKKIQAYNEEKLFQQADIILGTPIGLLDALSEAPGTHKQKYQFDTLVIDESGQCIEPLAWCIFPLADKFVLAGDHYQLPPTVLSEAAMRMGFNRSILEVSFGQLSHVFLLDTQYRMRASIAGFSSHYFYDNKLMAAPHLNDLRTHITFFDTAGSGYAEERGSNGVSLLNEGEIEIVSKIMDTEKLEMADTALISPYAGQVMLAKEKLPEGVRISTIDSFQGQEKRNIIISLVRSNDQQVIGFLNDYRRMNVAITRAKEQLFIIGDSATLGNDKFYRLLLEYIEERGAYRSVWELSE